MNAKLGHRISTMSQVSTSPTNTSIFSTLSRQTSRGSFKGDEEKVYVKESFIPPEISMINYFLDIVSIGQQSCLSTNTKDTKDTNHHTQAIDDCDELNLESNRYDLDDADDSHYSEHLNPKSYSWSLIRYAVVKLSLFNVHSIMEIIGIEPHELAILSPNAYEVFTSLKRWSEMLKLELDAMDGPPDNYMNDYSTSSFNGPKVFQYQSLLNPENTPFT